MDEMEIVTEKKRQKKRLKIQDREQKINKTQF